MEPRISIVTIAVAAVWGGLYGYYADPGGNLREVAHNRAFPPDADGGIALP